MVAEVNLESLPKALGVLQGWPLLGLSPSLQLSWSKGGRGFQVHEEIAVDHRSCARGTSRGELSRPISSSVSGIPAVLDLRAGSTLHLGKSKHPRGNGRFSKPGLIGSPVCVPPPVNPSSLEACCPDTQKTLDFTSLSAEPAQGEMAEDACSMNKPMSKAAFQPSIVNQRHFPLRPVPGLVLGRSTEMPGQLYP